MAADAFESLVDLQKQDPLAPPKDHGATREAPQHGDDADGEDQKHPVRTIFEVEPHPPSTTPITSLTSIVLSDLTPGIYHAGKILFIRTTGEPRRIQSTLQINIEDENGQSGLLELFSGDPKIDSQQILPKGAIFAVKEPFYQNSSTGEDRIRVNHPSDLLRFASFHPTIPERFAVESKEDATGWKQKGNAAYVNKNYITAIELYSQALAKCSDGEKNLRYDILRNRSIVNLYLHRYENAVADATASLIPSIKSDDTTSKNNNAKAHYRAGCAAYHLGNFAEAKSQFSKLLKLTPKDKDAVRELQRTSSRLEEQTSGEYDFAAMSNSASPRHNRLDHASFPLNGVVRKAGKKGRGLFATKNIAAGELILCEKAFDVAFDSDAEAVRDTSFVDTRSMLLSGLIEKAMYNPGQAKRLLDLSDGGYTPQGTSDFIDDNVVPVDTFRVAAVIQHNAFGCPTVRSSDKISSGRIGGRPDPDLSIGVWITASYANHACDANAYRSFIGDMMILRAVRDVPKGQEITHCYRDPDVDNHKMQEEMQRIWKFNCECNICSADAKTPEPQREERMALTSQAKAFIASHALSAGYHPDEATIAEADRMRRSIETTYDIQAFRDVPRLGLVELDSWLCMCYHHEATQPDKVIEAAHNALRDLGYKVKLSSSNLRVDRTNCYLSTSVIDAVMWAAHAYIKQDNVQIGRQFIELGWELYLTIYGEMRGFERRYSSNKS